MKRYEKYKPSGADWIDEIPMHWNSKRLKYVASVQPSNVDKKTIEGELPILLCNYMDVYKNEFIDSSISFMEATATEAEIAKFTIKKGDVLVTKDSETPDDIANPAFVKDDFENANLICAYHLTQIRPNRTELTGEYLFRLFQENKYKGQFEVAANGVTRFGLSVSAFSDAFVPLPHPEEQTAIANYLDEKTAQIDTLVVNKQKLIELLKEERTAIINHVVTKSINPKANLKPSGIEWLGDIPEHWEVKKLKYVAEARDDAIEDAEFKIAVENIENGTGKLINMEEDKNYQGTLSRFLKGDTIFNKLRPYLHKVYLAEKDGGLYGELLVIFPKGELLSEFLFYKLFSKSFIDIVDSSTYGTKMPRANWDDFIGHLLIAYPKDKKEQQAIVQHIKTHTSRIAATISKIEKEIGLLQEYRTALISEVVTGKIKVI